MERKYVVKSKIRKYPFICDMILGFCAVYLVSALFLIETDKWIESENIIKVIFFIGAILYGIYTCVKRLINYKIIAVTEKDFTIIKPFLFKSKTYLKRYIKEVVLDDTNMGKTIFVDAKIIMNSGEEIVFSNREFKNFAELIKTFNSKISTVKLEQMKEYF